VKGKGIIFDLDGTLLDTLHDLGEAMNAVLREHGIPEHSLEMYRTFVGEGIENLVRRVLPEEQRDEEVLVNMLVEKMRVEYRQRYLNHSSIYPGVPEMLDELESRGLPKAILSNKPHFLTVPMSKKMLNSWSFADVRGASPESPRKPDPAVALEIAGKMQIEPAEIIFVGDSDIDMQTARSAGMYGAGVLWGFRDAAELKRAGAQSLLTSPLELLDLMF